MTGTLRDVTTPLHHGEEGAEALREGLALLDLRRVPALLEYFECRVRHALVDLLRLVDRADPVVAPDRDPRGARDARQLGATVVRRVLVAHDEVAHGDAVACRRAREVRRRREALVEEVERTNRLERAA